ncbi:metallophosphoesterase [Lentisphaerota bacterium ZTH]|nr:metallophosphoesterase [Lentisphaerota bacterium]WET06509.1 metallophosphoesterase [Lentisphaerota bacterium ZTH]
MVKALKLKLVLLALCFLAGSVLFAAEFRFVQIADTELDETPVQDAHLCKIIDSINKLPFDIEFVVHTGDIVAPAKTLSEKANAIEARKKFKALKPPVYYVPGNHDIMTIDTRKCISNFETYFGPLFQKTVVKNVAIYFVWADMNYHDVFLANYDPLACLTAEMSKNPDQPAIIFTHIPPDKGFYANIVRPGWKPGIKEKWIKTLSKFNVKAMVCGHMHRDELQHLGKIPVYIGSSACDLYGRASTYRIYHYKDGVLDYCTIYPGDQDLHSKKKAAETK